MMNSPRTRSSSSQIQTKYIAIFSCGVLVGSFLSSLVLLSSSLQQCANTGSHHDDWDKRLDGTGICSDRKQGDQNQEEGWKQIHVFFGNTSHISDSSTIPTPYFNSNTWFSQYRQDEIISALLQGKKDGYFVDLAANDAVRISNTYALERDLGWDGICLEPNSAYWGGLSYRKCHVVGAVVGGNTPMEEVRFKFPKSKGPMGGIVGNEFDNHPEKTTNSNNQFEVCRRFTVPLLDVLRKFNAPRIIDYMSLDVEGAEDFVMSTFPFSEYRFNILTVERPSTKLSNILIANGYILHRWLKKGKETLWIHDSVKESLDLSAAMEIESQSYKYRESGNYSRIVPEREREQQRQQQIGIVLT